MDAAITADASELLAQLGGEVAAGRLVPYLGPELLLMNGAEPVVPAGARELSHRLAARVAVPGRIRNNLWHTAQYIESNRHRITVDKLAAEIFAPTPEPTAIHRWLAGLGVPLIVDTWYDGAMAAALNGAGDWGQVQGASKNKRTVHSPWVRAFDRDGAEVAPDQAHAWRTVLYKPHGAGWPKADLLVSDADLVEVLSELDIQTPIPDAVIARRTGRGFLYLGCRFYDQILRSFSRALTKHSGGKQYAVVPEGLTRNEERFLEVEGIIPIRLPLAEAARLLAGG